MLNIAEIITKEIFKVVILNKTIRGTAKPFSFPNLITSLCIMQGVVIPDQPRRRLRLSITKAYIRVDGVNPLDNA